MLLRGFVCITVLGLASSACDRDAIEPDRTAIRLAPDSTFALVGDTVVLTASVIDQSGQPIVSAVIGWSSSDTTVAKVDASGRVIARARGSAIITAKVNTASSSVKIVVGQIEGCQGIGVTHTDTGLPNDSATWHARQSPHFIQGSFTVTNRLTIEAGAIVCGLPDSELLVKREGELIAAGRADRSIRFMATDTTRRWRGIIAGALTGPEGGGLVRLTHVHVEWTSIGVVSAFQSSVRIDSSRFRQTSVLASANFSNLDMRRSVVDTGNVSLISGTFEDNIVRGGALFVARNQGTFAPIAVNGGRIEGSPGTAFQVGTRGGIPPSVISTRPLRITGSRGKPVSAPIDAFLNIWPTRAAQDSLLGNANDTLVVWSAATAHSLYVRRELPWHVICGLPVCSSGFTVTGL